MIDNMNNTLHTESDAGAKTQRFALTLSLPAVAAVLIVVALGFSWAFWLGIRAGQEQASPQPLERDLGNAAEAPAPSALPPDAAGQEEQGGLIPEEDLSFRESLARSPEPSPAAPSELPPRAEAAAEDASRVFIYEYQVASYSRQTQAEGLIAKLAGKNIQARLEAAQVQGQARYRVIVLFRGSEHSAAELRRTLKEAFRLEDILQRSKKAGA